MHKYMKILNLNINTLTFFFHLYFYFLFDNFLFYFHHLFVEIKRILENKYKKSLLLINLLKHNYPFPISVTIKGVSVSDKNNYSASLIRILLQEHLLSVNNIFIAVKI